MSNRLYTDDEIEEAYQYWAYHSGDSYPATAESLEIPERTVRNWGTRDNWRNRKSLEIADLAEPAVGLAQAELKLGLSAVARQQLSDATNQKLSAQDRRESAKLIFALASGLLQDEKIGSASLTLVDARQIHMAEQSAGLQPSELRKLASQYLEANVNTVHDNSRGPKRNR